MLSTWNGRVSCCSPPTLTVSFCREGAVFSHPIRFERQESEEVLLHSTGCFVQANGLRDSRLRTKTEFIKILLFRYEERDCRKLIVVISERDSLALITARWARELPRKNEQANSRMEDLFFAVCWISG